MKQIQTMLILFWFLSPTNVKKTWQIAFIAFWRVFLTRDGLKSEMDQLALCWVLSFRLSTQLHVEFSASLSFYTLVRKDLKLVQSISNLLIKYDQNKKMSPIVLDRHGRNMQVKAESSIEDEAQLCIWVHLVSKKPVKMRWTRSIEFFWHLLD